MDDEVELTDSEFLSELAERMFHRLTPAMGFNQGDTDRLSQIAREMREMGWTK